MGHLDNTGPGSSDEGEKKRNKITERINRIGDLYSQLRNEKIKSPDGQITSGETKREENAQQEQIGKKKRIRDLFSRHRNKEKEGPEGQITSGETKQGEPENEQQEQIRQIEGTLQQGASLPGSRESACRHALRTRGEYDVKVVIDPKQPSHFDGRTNLVIIGEGLDMGNPANSGRAVVEYVTAMKLAELWHTGRDPSRNPLVYTPDQFADRFLDTRVAYTITEIEARQELNMPLATYEEQQVYHEDFLYYKAFQRGENTARETAQVQGRAATAEEMATQGRLSAQEVLGEYFDTDYYRTHYAPIEQLRAVLRNSDQPRPQEVLHTLKTEGVILQMEGLGQVRGGYNDVTKEGRHLIGISSDKLRTLDNSVDWPLTCEWRVHVLIHETKHVQQGKEGEALGEKEDYVRRAIKREVDAYIYAEQGMRELGLPSFDFQIISIYEKTPGSETDKRAAACEYLSSAKILGSVTEPGKRISYYEFYAQKYDWLISQQRQQEQER